MSKLYGLIVTRSKHGTCKFPVWCISEEAREDRKKFILENVSCTDYDGITSFEHVESGIIIKEVGQWVRLESGKYGYVDRFSVDMVDCLVYVFKNKKLPKIIPESVKVLWLCRNGYYSTNKAKRASLC